MGLIFIDLKLQQYLPGTNEILKQLLTNIWQQNALEHFEF